MDCRWARSRTALSLDRVVRGREKRGSVGGRASGVGQQFAVSFVWEGEEEEEGGLPAGDARGGAVLEVDADAVDGELEHGA